MLSMNPKETVIPNVALFPMFFSLFNGTVNTDSSASAGDRMQVPKLLGINKTDLVGTLAVQHSQATTKQVLTLDSAQAGQFSFTAPAKPTVANFRLVMILLNGQTAEFHEGKDHYRKEVDLQTIIPAGASTADVVQAIYDGLNDYFYNNPLAEVRYAATIATPQAGQKVLTLTTVDPRIKLELSVKSRLFSSDDQDNVLLALKPAETTPAYEGVGTYLTMLPKRLQTEVTNEPYMNQGTEVASDGQNYTCVTFSQLVRRPDLGGTSVIDQKVEEQSDYQFWVLESAANKAWLTNLLTFLDGAGSPASAVTKKYTQADGTPAANLAAFLAAWPS